MSRIKLVILLDDLANDDTTEADETVQFSLDGVDYEIDLTEANAQKLRARLKEFTQAGRVVPKRRRLPRPMTEPAGASATLSRHQGGIDPKAARAWATEHGLIAPKQRGVLGRNIKDAYNAFQRGDIGPLNKLKQAQNDHGTTPATDKPNTPPEPPKRRPLHAVPEPPAEPEPQAEADEDYNEAKAREYYQPLTQAQRHPDVQDDQKWDRRTGYGVDRTEKIKEWTLTERIATVSNQHATILNQLAGITALNSKGGVSYLKTSATRLHNLEFIKYAPTSLHGWEITNFGRYAVRIHGMG
ncbi:histone-like nucleoid-structuring protein Lsr2 [Streptomyces sp. NBC_01451]|uniref:histone-like nucleoid-structuring protein Lsr2 n=1 Tax=Streptomyces sp. NBC_01451 TaxID=2903872 RepID=UPI002E3217B4|nr:Lsr2 family protein [Streptomyces sp. NBC_01451]